MEVLLYYNVERFQIHAGDTESASIRAAGLADNVDKPTDTSSDSALRRSNYTASRAGNTVFSEVSWLDPVIEYYAFSEYH